MRRHRVWRRRPRRRAPRRAAAPHRAAAAQFTDSFEMLTDTRTDRIAVGVYDGLMRIKLEPVTAPAPTSP